MLEAGPRHRWRMSAVPRTRRQAAYREHKARVERDACAALEAERTARQHRFLVRPRTPIAALPA